MAPGRIRLRLVLTGSHARAMERRTKSMFDRVDQKSYLNLTK